MFTITSRNHRSGHGIGRLAGAGLLAVAFSIGGYAQTGDQNAANANATQKPQASVAKLEPMSMPLLKAYKEVTIGSTADEVRDKLGKAKIDDKDGFYYRFDDSEMVQIRLDEDLKVQLIAITYAADNKGVPSFSDVLGAEPSPTDTKPDGSIYKLVRYPAAGYWVAYSKTGGPEPSVSVTMQKLR